MENKRFSNSNMNVITYITEISKEKAKEVQLSRDKLAEEFKDKTLMLGISNGRINIHYVGADNKEHEYVILVRFQNGYLRIIFDPKRTDRYIDPETGKSKKLTIKSDEGTELFTIIHRPKKCNGGVYSGFMNEWMSLYHNKECMCRLCVKSVDCRICVVVEYSSFRDPNKVQCVTYDIDKHYQKGAAYDIKQSVYEAAENIDNNIDISDYDEQSLTNASKMKKK